MPTPNAWVRLSAAHPWQAAAAGGAVIGAWALLLTADWRGGLAAGALSLLLLRWLWTKRGPARRSYERSQGK